MEDKRRTKDRCKEGRSGNKTGVGKRRFTGDWERRIWLCERLVRTVEVRMEFGAEIWGWRKWKKVEAMQERWIRWTPRYMVREEIRKEKLRIGNREKASRI